MRHTINIFCFHLNLNHLTFTELFNFFFKKGGIILINALCVCDIVSGV